MGNTPLSDFESQFKQNYAFIQVLDDLNFGVVKIYRKRQINFDYVMVYDQSLSGSSLNERIKKLQQLQYVRTHPHEQILRLFYFQQIEKNAFECKVDVIRMYVEYYNFTLENLIENNARGMIQLTYDEILYIINSIISVYLYFDQIKANWFRIHPSQIFISTSGCVYFSPMQISRSFGDQVSGCVMKSGSHQKPAILQPTDAYKSYQKLKQLLYNLIEHHSLVNFQQYQRLQEIFDTVNTIKAVAQKIPKSSRTQLDMNKQIYRDDSSAHSNKRQNMSNSTSNRSVTFHDDRIYRKY